MATTFPTAPGELAALIRGHDWPATPVGPIDAWPTNLRVVVDLMLHARVPIVLLWGAQGTLIYNDAYAGFAGPRHPTQLGSPVLDAWPEVAAFNAEIMRVVYGLGQTLAFPDHHLVLLRRGVPEDVWMDLDYSPISGEDGRPAGVMAVVVETTARHLSEAALAGAREQIQLALDSGSIMGTWAWHAQDDRVTGDAGTAATLGIPGTLMEQGVTLSRMLARIHPDDQRRIGGLLAEAARTGSAFRAQFRTELPTLEGSEEQSRGTRWIEAGGRCEPDQLGQTPHFRGVLIDIDDRRRAEERLAASEASLRLAADAAEIGIWDLDINTDALVWSQRVQAMFGITPGSVYDMRDFYAQLHPADREATTRAFDAAVDPATRLLYDVEYRVIGRDDGVLRWIAAKGRGLFDDDGTCVRAVGTAIDITQRVQAEAGRLFLTALADKLRDLTDPVAAIAAVEDALRAMLPAACVRLSSGGAIAETPPALGQMPPITITRHGVAAATLIVAAGEPRRWSGPEIEICREAAERGWIAVERAGAERALRDLAATLEQRVEQRTAELQAAEAALRQAQKMEAVGQLTGGIAHDFNNMLSIVIGGLGLAQRRLAKGDTAIDRFLNAATEGAERAAALTQRLLAFSRQQPLRPQALDVAELVAGMSDLLCRAVGEQVQLETRLAPGLWQVCVDPVQLENALLNLAVNARDAMDGAGLLRIEVSNQIEKLANATEGAAKEAAVKEAGAKEAGADHVVIAVTDTGTGMTQEVAARAFDPFFTTKEVGRGSGLGLSQVYGFANQSGGHAVIRTAPGKGTTVSLFLRRHDAPEQPRPPASHSPVAPPAKSGETVLVVEDDERVRQLSVAAVRELGYTVLHAESGQAALALLDANPSVELLLTDIVMPVMNGRELAEEARRRHPDLRVLYTSGFSRNTLTPEADLLPKPFTLEQLAFHIDAVMARAR